MSIPTQPQPEPGAQAAPQASFPPQGYAAPAQQPPAYQVQPVPARPSLPTTMAATNAFAVVAVIVAFIQPIAGIVFGHLALGQIKRNGDSGRGLALTGLILGYAYLAFILLFVLFYISMIAIMIGSIGAAVSEFGSYDYYDSY